MANGYAKYSGISGGGVASLNGETGAITLVAGSGILITPSGSNITISNTEAGGSVTSVSVVTANGLSGTVANPTTTPAITLTGILAGDITGGINSNALTATSNSTLTTLSSLSLPGAQVTGNISGNATNVTGTVAIANGGTGQITANAALNALLPSQTGNAGDVLTTNGTNTSWTPAGSGANTSLSNLSSVAVNTTLSPTGDSVISLGASNSRWNNLWMGGEFFLYNGSAANNNMTMLFENTLVDSTSVNNFTLVAVNDTGTGGYDLALQTSKDTTANSNQTGNIWLQTGPKSAGSGNSGNITLKTGSITGSTGTRGLIQLRNGTEGTAGQVWTSTDTNGSGSWQPSSGGSGLTLQTATFNISTVQLNTLTVTPITLMAAIPGKTINIDYVDFQYNFVTTPYTVGGGSLFVGYTNDVGTYSFNLVDVGSDAGFLDQTSNQEMINASSRGSLERNQGLSFSTNDTTITGGDGTVTLVIYYFVLN